MDPLTADLLFTLASSAVVLGLGALAVLVLPWSDRDLLASRQAWLVLVTLPVHLVGICPAHSSGPARSGRRSGPLACEPWASSPTATAPPGL